MIEQDANVIAANLAIAHSPGGDLNCVTCGDPWPCNSAILAIGYATAIRQRDIAGQRVEGLEATCHSLNGSRINEGKALHDAKAALNAVQKLHRPLRTTIGKVGEQWTSTKGPGLWCECCQRRWPCETARAAYPPDEIARIVEGGDAAEAVAPDIEPGRAGLGGLQAGVAGSAGVAIDDEGSSPSYADLVNGGVADE